MSAEREEILAVLRLHRIECTGLGEVTCRACRDLSWMPWQRYFEHLADHILPVMAKQ